MRHQVDVVGLAHRGDLHRLGEAADVAHVDPRELGDAPLDVRQELPLAGELLADRERHVGHAAQRLVRLGRLVADRLLEEVERALRHALAERSGLGDREPVVVVDAERRPGPDRLAQPGQPLGGRADRLARLEVAAALGLGRRVDPGADHVPAAGEQQLCVLDQPRAHRRAGWSRTAAPSRAAGRRAAGTPARRAPCP